MTEDELSWLENTITGLAPTVLDLTAGGGSIPFEAGRLGFQTIANELNPVASLILRATCEWPQKFGQQLLKDYREVSEKFQARVNELLLDVYPEEPQPDCTGGQCPHPQRYHCTENCPDPNSCTHPKTGSKNHETVRAQRHVWAYVWARTVKCPACESTIPLSPSWMLDNKGTGIQLEPGGDGCRFRIVHDRKACPDCRKNDPKKPCNTATLHPDGDIDGGTEAGAVAVCPKSSCGTTTAKGYLAREAQAERMGHQLYAIIYRDSWTEKTKSGTDKKRPTTFRGFAEVTPDNDNWGAVAKKLEDLGPRWTAKDVLPNEEVPIGNDQRPHTYSMEKWIKMFNPRQQLAHGHCVEAFRESVGEDEKAMLLDECRKAAWCYIALGMDKLINRNSLLCIWDSGETKVANTFDRHDFAFKWSYAEMAVACQGVGLKWSLNEVGNCLSELLEMTGQGEDPTLLIKQEDSKKTPSPTWVINSEAQFIPQLDDSSIDCIVFDPPYEANVSYAELSDFFYVWLKRTAGFVFPEDFTRHPVRERPGSHRQPSPVQEHCHQDCLGPQASDRGL